MPLPAPLGPGPGGGAAGAGGGGRPVAHGLLGQPGYGGKTRSVSASDLDRYSICPSLYFLRNVSYLPGEVGSGEVGPFEVSAAKISAA